jgi:hypothetical protein
VAEFEQKMAKYQDNLRKRLNRWDPFRQDFPGLKPPEFPNLCASNEGRLLNDSNGGGLNINWNGFALVLPIVFCGLIIQLFM